MEKNKVDDKKPLYLLVIEYLRFVAIIIGITVCLSNHLYVNAEIPTESMVSLLNVDDRIFGLRLAYLLAEPKRFDVAIFKYPVDETQMYIKRIIGLPGETVEIKEGKIYIDHSETPLSEDYLPEEWVSANDGYVFQVPEDSYLFLGDNRNISDDARFWSVNALDEGVASSKEEAEAYTYVKSDKILAKAIFKYYPKIEMVSK